MTLRFADLPLRAKGIVIITVPLALLLAALASVFVADRQSRIAEDQVRVTLEIQSGIQEIHASIAEAATAMRGYLLTGRTDFLDPFNRAEDRLPVVLDEVGRRLRDEEQKDAPRTHPHARRRESRSSPTPETGRHPARRRARGPCGQAHRGQAGPR
ncbi:CHASE3 domain-containing protein [Rhizobium aouanii]|uniref:CHASE3 domain-containing protein n=1 Tax=Rhizobium aouanii TaxID=3118145 RepID=A0ABU8CLT9_9HYPH